MIEKKIHSLIGEGDVLFRYPLKIYCGRDTGGDGGLLVISVPKRHFKRAVKRNLLKRRIRGAFRASGWPSERFGADVLAVYIGDKVEEYDKICESVSSLLEKIAGVASDTVDKAL